jgi:hypothetical protein
LKQDLVGGNPAKGDRDKANQRLGSFDWRKSQELEELYRRCGCEMNHNDLLVVAKVAADRAGLVVDRDAKRRKSVLVRWFHDNWHELLPHIPDGFRPNG